MELKVRGYKAQVYRVIRVLAIAILPVLLTFYILQFKEFNEYLVSLNPWKVIPHGVWVLFTKFLSYCLHIGINFCILLAVTNRLKYSLWFVYIAFAFLLLGAALIWLGGMMHITVPGAVTAIFVKANKSLVLLVLFIAGHFVRRVHPTERS